jgi:hypothetical protein
MIFGIELKSAKMDYLLPLARSQESIIFLSLQLNYIQNNCGVYTSSRMLHKIMR